VIPVPVKPEQADLQSVGYFLNFRQAAEPDMKLEFVKPVLSEPSILRATFSMRVRHACCGRIHDCSAFAQAHGDHGAFVRTYSHESGSKQAVLCIFVFYQKGRHT
jgi:hypothetical protein